MYLVYRLLLCVVHFLYWCWESVVLLLLLARKKYDSLWARSELTDDFWHICEWAKQVKNLPSHLAFILVDEDTVSVHDLANVVVWSFAAGVSFLTFYDHDGKIKMCEKKLMQELATRADSKIFKNIVWDTMTCSNGHSEKPKENGYTNGYRNGFSNHKLRINLMSYEDGRPKLIRAAVELGLREKMSRLSRNQRLSVNEADEVIRAVYQTQFGSMPDPSLAIWCGTTPCLAGFLPWHTSLTEFLHVPSHQGINAAEFRDLILRYSKCEQRFGK